MSTSGNIAKELINNKQAINDLNNNQKELTEKLQLKAKKILEIADTPTITEINHYDDNITLLVSTRFPIHELELEKLKELFEFETYSIEWVNYGQKITFYNNTCEEGS